MSEKDFVFNPMATTACTEGAAASSLNLDDMLEAQKKVLEIASKFREAFVPKSAFFQLMKDEKPVGIRYGGIRVHTHDFHSYVQRRKHRKRRINKKWRKKYGMMRVDDDKVYFMDTSFLKLVP